MELYEAMRTTPATRSFTDERVEDAVLHRMLEHARFAPNGGNRQGWRVIVLKDPAIRTRLWELYQLGWREYVEHGRQGLPFAARDAGRWTGPAIDLAAAREIPAPNDLADNLEHVPALLLIVADLGALAAVDNGLDRQSMAARSTRSATTCCWPRATKVSAACLPRYWRGRSLGYARCWASRGSTRSPGLLALGHPRKVITRLRRAPVEEFTVVDRFGGPTFTG